MYEYMRESYAICWRNEDRVLLASLVYLFAWLLPVSSLHWLVGATAVYLLFAMASNAECQRQINELNFRYGVVNKG